MKNLATQITYDEYCLIWDSEKQYELLNGRLHMVPAPRPYHQRILRKIGFILQKFVNENDLGEVFFAPTDVVLSPTEVVQPDIFLIAKDHMDIITEENISGSPDLIIEILSQLGRDRDRIIKRKMYAQHGVKEYWIVDPDEKTVELLVLGDEGYRAKGIYSQQESLESDLLPGLTIDLKEIF
jgi:Uma2 family endonuclease